MRGGFKMGRKPVQRPKRLFHRDRTATATEPAGTEHLDMGAPAPPGTDLIPTPPDMLKMSEVLGDFVAPWFEQDMSMSDHQKLLDLAIVAWNLACLPGPERAWQFDRSLIRLVPAETSPADRDMARQFLAAMVERKLAEFATIRRMIYACKLTDQGNRQRHLSVSSSFDEL